MRVRGAVIQSIRLRSRVAGRVRAVTWLELFFDLVFVAAISQVGSPFAEDYSLPGLMRYAFMFLLIWWAWLGHTMYATRFDSDDLMTRLLTLVQMFAAAVMAANAKDMIASRDSAGFVAAYAFMRILLVAQYLRARQVPESRRAASVYAAGFGAAAALWILGALLPTPVRFAIWAAALGADLGTPWLASSDTRGLPPDAAHLPERFGLFTIILLGENVAAIMRGIESQNSWTVPAAASAFTALALAFGYWWWYFDAAAAAEERQLRSTDSLAPLQVWIYAHFPLYLAIAVGGIGVEHAIALGVRMPHLPQLTAWMLLGSATVLMAALSVITLCSDDASSRQTERFYWQLVIASAGILAVWLASRVPPYLLLAYLLVLCTLEVILSTRSNLSTFEWAILRAPSLRQGAASVTKPQRP